MFNLGKRKLHVEITAPARPSRNGPSGLPPELGVPAGLPPELGVRGGVARYVVAGDLGQANDPTAFVVNRQVLPTGHDEDAETRMPPAGCSHEIVWARRFRLGTPYPAVVREIRALMDQPPLKCAPRERTITVYQGVKFRRTDDGELEPILPPPPPEPPEVLLVLDATGVGRPVVDMFREAGLEAASVTLTGGTSVNKAAWNDWSVPKRDLVSIMQVLMQSRRLRISGDLEEAQALRKELLSFRVRISDSGADTYGAWREKEHDDLVLATALACWAGENVFRKRMRFYP